MNLAPQLPSFGTTQAALRRTTERLARELRAPSDTPPDWNAFEWSVARAAASLHGISALLANRLRWSSPAHWADFLAGQLAESRVRDRHIGTLLADLDQATRVAGVGVVALKGSALRSLRLYDAGERPQGDVDLLVEPAGVPRVAQALETLGYVPAYADRRHDVFEPRIRKPTRPFGEHQDNPLKIEVHTRIAEALPSTPVNITARLAPRDVAPGLNPYRDHIALMMHLALHAAGNMRAHALRFVQLRDMALLAARLDARAWNELTNLSREFDGSWWLAAPLALVERYHPGALPHGMLEELWRHAPGALRRALARQELTDVSWSNLRIHAFPGIEWARSAREALRFARSRIAPSRQARAELAQGVEKIPMMRVGGWYGASHPRRILRWLFGRPPRVQTLSILNEALRFDAGPGQCP